MEKNKKILWNLLVIALVLMICLGSSTRMIQHNQTGVMKGVLDRFEDNDKGVVLIEEINKEFIVPKRILPKGSKVNMWFNIKIKDDEYEILSIDYLTTEIEADKSAALMKGLQQK